MLNTPLTRAKELVTPKPDPTEISPRVVGVVAHNALPGHSSPSRLNMDSNHIASHQTLVHSDKKESLISGVEYELGKYIDDVRVPRDCIVVGTVHKMPNNPRNPETILFVQYEENGHVWVDAIQIKYYKSKHSYFGYELKPTDLLLSVRHGTSLNAGDVLATSSSYGSDGIYKYGVNANLVFSSDVATAEDGFVVSESFLERLKFQVIEKRVFHLTKNNYMLNLYGDDDIYKCLPEIGEKVKSDELLAVIRDRDDYLSIAELNNDDIRTVDHTFDKKCYVEVGSEVVDVRVHKGTGNKSVYSEGMSQQLDAYHEYNLTFADNIVRTYNSVIRAIEKQYRGMITVEVGPKLNILTSDALIFTELNNSRRRLTFDRKPIDQYRVEVITKTVYKPSIGYKLTDMFGGE